jgi:TldD protein
MLELLKHAEEMGVDFADLRRNWVKVLSASVSDDRITVPSNGVEEGYSIRVLYRNSWGYRTSTKLSREDLEEAVKTSFGDERVSIVNLPPKRDSIYVKPKVSLDVPMERKLKTLKAIRDQLKSSFSAVKSVTVSYREEKVRKEYYSTEGREIEQSWEFSYLSLRAYAMEGEVVASSFSTASTYYGYVLEMIDLNQLVDDLINKLKAQLKGVPPKAGEYTVVLSPQVVGVFSHEAIGHLAEADLAVNGILRNLIGRTVARSTVSVSDSPSLPADNAIGFTPYDDEGVEGREVRIVEQGKVREVMNDRYYASYFGQPPTGNGRTEDFRSPVLIRMRNTYMKPGDMQLDELLEGIKEGFLMVSPVGGQTSPDGTFQFGIQEGYRIVNSEIGESLRNVGISGYTLETLSKIDGVSKDFQVWPGFCGKGGQLVPVSTAGPYIRVRELKVGGVA